MLNSLALLALAAASTLASPTPQGVTSAIPPEAPAPEGCQPSYSGSFQISAVNVTSSSAKRDLERRQDGVLLLTLQNSVLTDQAGRTGYVAANYQFQFDAPPQAGAIYTSGFSLCSNGSLALGGSAIWYQCLSGSFYNLYDRNWAEHCNAIYLYALIGSTAPPASQGSDGQVTVTQDAATVTQIPDGQIQATTGIPVSQIPDGQIQATTGVPVSQIPDGQIQATTGVPVSQIPDGQIQATTGVPVSQIPDGQIQATTGVPVSQISDGQIQATTGGPAITQISDGQIQAPTATVPPVSQISDGQIQAPTATVPPVSQISDGQIQAPTATVPPVSQISDGQIQAPTGTTAAPATFTGAAHRAELGGSMALIAGIAGAVALL